MIHKITKPHYVRISRGQSVGMCSTVSRVFGLFAPFVTGLATYWKPLPMLGMGIIVILFASFIFLLPETMDVNLPLTMDEAINLGNIKKEKEHYFENEVK